MLQSGKVEGERSQHRQQREQQEEESLGGRIMGRRELPRRVDQKPEQRGAAGGVEQNDPAIAPGQNVVSADVVKGERKSRKQGGEDAQSVQAKPGAAEQT